MADYQNTFIKLSRKILKWEWYNDLNTFKLFVHLLLTVNVKDKKWQGITIKRGEIITSVSALAKETGLSVSRVRTSLRHLQSTNEITVNTTAKYTVIKVTLYNEYQNNQKNDKVIDKVIDKVKNSEKSVMTRLSNNKYQSDDKQIANNLTNKSQSDDKVMTTTKEYKEYKEYKEDDDIGIAPRDVIFLFKKICKSYPISEEISDKRKLLIEDCMKKYGIEKMKKVFEKAEQSEFLKGKNQKRWKANFDWLIKPDNFIKVLEGNYDESYEDNVQSNKKSALNNFNEREYDFRDVTEALRRKQNGTK